VTSRLERGVTLVGPVRPNVSGLSFNKEAYDISKFKVNWETQEVTC